MQNLENNNPKQVNIIFYIFKQTNKFIVLKDTIFGCYFIYFMWLLDVC